VTAAAARTDGEVRLTVTDDGSGIGASLLPRIFERFVRGDSSRFPQAGSSGLGLAIVRAVVAAHDGRGDGRKPTRPYPVHGEPAARRARLSARRLCSAAPVGPVSSPELPGSGGDFPGGCGELPPRPGADGRTACPGEPSAVIVRPPRRHGSVAKGVDCAVRLCRGTLCQEGGIDLPRNRDSARHCDRRRHQRLHSVIDRGSRHDHHPHRRPTQWRRRTVGRTVGWPWAGRAAAGRSPTRRNTFDRVGADGGGHRGDDGLIQRLRGAPMSQ
jgi:hypothetical protein